MNCEILKMVSLKKDFARKAREWKVVNDDKGSEKPCRATNEAG